MERVAMYLRKSRADIEAENRGEEETLAKHKRALFKLAKDMSLNIIKVRQEVVSGESLIHRPEMMELLKEVENKDYEAVLVMDMDRLGRGNMREQGLILETFQNSGTKIITPRKTYDLEDEFDEEYSEFEAFMARKELKIITRRMQNGKKRSVMEGDYCATRPPYGYQIFKDKEKRTLVPDPEQSPVVKMIFDWYTNDNPEKRIGTRKIAHKLNELGYLSYTGKTWDPMCVLLVVKNAVYTGRIQWKKEIRKKSKKPEQKFETSIRPKEQWIDVEGHHEAIISNELYDKAQEILNKRSHIPYNSKKITNPLASLIRCKECNSSMVKRNQERSRPRVACVKPSCRCRSSVLEIVEQQLFHSLHEWLKEYKISFSEQDFKQKENKSTINGIKTSIHNLQKEIKSLQEQKEKLHDFLERGIYDENTYLERSNNISSRTKHTQVVLKKAIEELEIESKRVEAKVKIIPNVEHVLETYPLLEDPMAKNMLLKSVIDYCTYEKKPHQKLDEFTLELYPRL